jgi:hypothetical protein
MICGNITTTRVGTSCSLDIAIHLAHDSKAPEIGLFGLLLTRFYEFRHRQAPRTHCRQRAISQSSRALQLPKGGRGLTELVFEKADTLESMLAKLNTLWAGTARTTFALWRAYLGPRLQAFVTRQVRQVLRRTKRLRNTVTRSPFG